MTRLTTSKRDYFHTKLNRQKKYYDFGNGFYKNISQVD